MARVSYRSRDFQLEMSGCNYWRKAIVGLDAASILFKSL